MKTFYLELSEEEANGTSHKFYEVIIDDTKVTIRYGRIGTDGTASSQTFGTAAEAEKFAQKKVNEKKRKGYEEAVRGVRKKREITRRTITSSASTVKNRVPILWRFKAKSAAFGIFVDKNACWVGDESGAVYKLNHQAELQVQYQFPDGVKCLVADGNWIYLGCDDGNVYDLSGKTPRLAYEINEQVDIFWIDIKNGLLAVSDRGGNLSIINYEDEQQWANKMQGESAWMVRCDEVGRVFYGDSQGVSAFYGWEDHHAIWNHRTNPVLFGYLGNANVYAATTASTVHSFSREGEPLQIFKADNTVFSCATSPDEQYVFAGDNYSSVYCFNRSGERLWKLATGCGSAYSMQYFEEKLYIVTTDGSLACIDVSEAAIAQAKEGQVTEFKEIKAPNSKAALVQTDVLEQAAAGTQGVLLECVKEGGKLRVKVLTAGFRSDWYVQFPKNLRQEGKIYLVDNIQESAQGGFYRVLGNIYSA